MHRQFNSLVETLRRIAFITFIGLYTTYLIFCVVAMARPGVAAITMAALAFSATMTLRYIGYRWLDFSRLSQSFPSGCPLDRIPLPIRNEVEQLVVEFHALETDWVRRTEIRHRLIELEEMEPDVIVAYESELKRVLAA